MSIKYFLKLTAYVIISILSLMLLMFISIFLYGKNRQKIIFGSTPILNNKYWAKALKEKGNDAETLMKSYYSTINTKEDFDKYFYDLIPTVFQRPYLQDAAYLLFVWLYLIQYAKIIVMPFDGFVFKKYFWRFEYFLCKMNHIKVVILPYGYDAYMYSKIKDVSLQNALLISYPKAAINEQIITRKVFFWSQYAECVISGFMGCDGMPRWDIPIFQWIQINTNEWKKKNVYSMHDGKTGAVKILHSPNHRGFKGTEYLIKAVNDLKNEGLQIDLILLEKVPNKDVLKWMQEGDILAEQFIATAYALSGIEGMASGLPVLANLDQEVYTTIFRRYSFLNECPILSTTPETLKDNLRLLVTTPELRKELGGLGRQYVEKYHSYAMTNYLFTSIFKKLDGDDVDLMNLFHPLKSEYVQKNYIITPLINNKYLKF